MEQNENYKKGFEKHYYICSCTGLSNWCAFVLANQLDGSFVPATELDLNRFWPLPFGEIVWHLSTLVNNGLLAAYINIFDPRKDKRRCFIPCLVYTLVNTSIASNLFFGYPKSSVWICLYAHLLSVIEETPLKVTQGGQNGYTNKLIASVK